MATFIPLKGGRIRAQIRLLGVKDSENFDTKSAAKVWATRREAEILAGARGEIPPDKTFGDLLAKYRDEVSAGKKGHRWEKVRINRILGNDDPLKGKVQRGDPIALVPLRELNSTHVASWKARRLQDVSGASVRREWGLLSAACAHAIPAWKWLKENPFAKEHGIKRPPKNKHRQERFFDDDVAALRRVADASTTPIYRRLMRVFHFGLETAMRSGEILFLGDNPHFMDTDARVATLPPEATKNGAGREVPLSAEACRLWQEAVDEGLEGNIWGFSDETRDIHWRNLRELAEREYPPIGRLVFHDTRHTALTALAKKLTLLELTRMSGHLDPRELMTYYNETAAEIALKL